MVSVRSNLPEGLGIVFTTAEAAQWGVGRGRLSADDIERLFPGVYAIKGSGILTDRERLDTLHQHELWRRHQLRSAAAFQKVMKPHLFFCGRTAAVIRGLPVPPQKWNAQRGLHDQTDTLSALDCRVEVACIVPASFPRVPGVRARRLRQHLVTTELHRGKRLTSAPTTWATLADELAIQDLVALGDAILWQDRIPGTTRLKRPPHAQLRDLEQELARGRRPGILAASSALSLLSPHSASPPESHMRLQLQAWGFPQPVLDYDVYDAHGRLLGCSEMAYPDFKVALEYEGDHHRTSQKQWNRDIEKVHDYTVAGWITIRVTGQLLYKRTQELFRSIDETLRSRGWRP